MTLTLQFLGAAETVTGSRYLLQFKKKNYLIDCGLFQGLKSLRLRNWEHFPVAPSEIAVVILTHAHIDHSGYIPKLIQQGFRGKIYSTAATRDLCRILLPDSAHLMKEDAEYLNDKKKTKHSPALPLFTVEEALKAVEQFETVPFHKQLSLDTDLSLEFRYTGHILGASSVILEAGGKKIAFTGDVGRNDDKLLFPPDPLPDIDYLVTESTYGNRLHKQFDAAAQLERVLKETIARKGVLLVPAFAVGRTQTLIYEFNELRKNRRIPNIPIYLNSPMAMSVNDVFESHSKLHKLSKPECESLFDSVKYVKTVEESKRLNRMEGPMVIIAGSGMMTGGRILHHVKAFGPNPANSIMLVGYQSEGTRGRSLQEGADEIKLLGGYVRIRAHVYNIDNMSAHADFRELMEWFQASKIRPKKVFVTHGERSAADEFRRRLNEEFGWDAIVPAQEQNFELT